MLPVITILLHQTEFDNRIRLLKKVTFMLFFFNENVYNIYRKNSS